MERWCAVAGQPRRPRGHARIPGSTHAAPLPLEPGVALAASSPLLRESWAVYPPPKPWNEQSALVFVLGGGRGHAVDHSKPLSAPRWTEVVKAVLKRQAGVAFAPKDLRSSFITFLLSDANTNEALKKAVATAMRHSTALQGSATYDKERAERTWASAVQVAGAYAARFECTC